MEIKSSLFKYNEFKHLKNSIINISKIDDKQNFRVKMIEYINDTADNADDMFFFDMLPYSRFLHPNSDSIAYTTPEHLIYLNAPGKVGEKLRVWDFIYCHECLHQLWETFGVADKIKKEGLEYNHRLLNIASDCVINDFLKTYRKKSPFENGIFPETLKENYGIEYDRKYDTQYSLYVKLLEAYKQYKNELDELAQQLEDMMGDGEGEGNSSGNQQQSSGNSSDKKSGDKGDKQSGSGSSSDNADDKGDGSEKGNGGKGEKSDKNSEDKQSGSGDSSDKGDDKGDNSSGNKGDKGNQGEPQSGDKSDDSASDGDGDKSKSGSGNKNDGGPQRGNAEGGSGHESEQEDADIDEIIKGAESVIEKYRNKLSGPIGEFIGKCSSSAKLKKEGLQVKTYKGQSGWNTKMNQIIQGFVKKKVFQKKREYEKTYARIKRGSGFVKWGQPISPGRKVKEDKMNIDCGFYLDVSASMGSNTKLVFEAVFRICEALKKQFGKESVVDKTLFRTWAFNHDIWEVPFGKTESSSGTTMPFNELLQNINKFTKEYLINVIITDAQFNVDVSSIKKLLDDIDGIVLFITNCENETIKELSGKYSTKLYYILANSDFKLDN